MLFSNFIVPKQYTMHSCLRYITKIILFLPSSNPHLADTAGAFLVVFRERGGMNNLKWNVLRSLSARNDFWLVGVGWLS